MLYDHAEYREQVRLHTEMVKREFGQSPKVFRHTELLYSDGLAAMAHEFGFQGIVAEGIDRVLGWRSPNSIYSATGSPLKVLLRNHQLSDAISFRFRENGSGSARGMAARHYAEWLHTLSDTADVVGVFMDYETFGEHYREESGIFDLLEALPAAILSDSEWNFAIPSEALARCAPIGVLSAPDLTSWADTERDDSAWRGDEMQRAALRSIYDVGTLLKSAASVDHEAIEQWRRLQASDHFYYMSTKGCGDGAVHRSFSPFESPYEAFIAYMNAVRHFSRRIGVESLNSSVGVSSPHALH
jgi:alpha-amylase